MPLPVGGLRPAPCHPEAQPPPGKVEKIKKGFVFFGPVRNDWHHAESLWESIRRNFRPFPCSALLVDDASSPQQRELAGRLAARYPGQVRVIFNEINRGIPASLNTILDQLGDGIALPVPADVEFCNPVLPWRMMAAFTLSQANFFFYKCRHVDASNGRTTAITGWSGCRGIQKKENILQSFLEGSTRPSGYAVAFRTSVLKKLRYDPLLGPMCDSYLNNLMLLKYRSYYWGKVGITTLERPGSFSKKLNRAEHEQILAKIMSKLETDGVRLNEEQRRQLLETERSAFSG